MAQRQLVYRSPGGAVEVWYRPDRKSIARCAVGPELHEAVQEITGDIARPFAVGIAPKRTGNFARSMETATAYVAMGFPDLMTRVVGRLIANDPGAVSIEWGARGRPGHHTLGKTLAMLEAIRSAREVRDEAEHRARTGHAGFM